MNGARFERQQIAHSVAFGSMALSSGFSSSIRVLEVVPELSQIITQGIALVNNPLYNPLYWPYSDEHRR